MLTTKAIGNFVYGDKYRHGNWDDMLAADLIKARVRPDFTVLEVGAGAGRVGYVKLKGQVAKVIGIDPDRRVIDNPLLDVGVEGFAESIPLDSASIDLAYSINCLEHLPNPQAAFTEIARVLKPGGLFITKTPLKWHYVAIIARLTPQRFHEWFNRELRKRDDEDTFPTVYRVNSITAQRRIARATGFVVRDMIFCEGRPGYLQFNAVAYCLGIVYERVVTLLGLNGLKSVVITVFEKR